ncbi:hypothetical protein ACJD0Z_03270 [Flavobacteriaceae bacterium M23B6Z8]
MKGTRINITILIVAQLISFAGVLFLYLELEEAKEQRLVIEEQNAIMWNGYLEEQKQTNELKTYNFLTNEKLLFDLKEYLINTNVQPYNSSVYGERLRNFVRAKKYQQDKDTLQLVKLPKLNLYYCDLDNEESIYCRVDFSNCELPRTIKNTSFKGSNISLPSNFDRVDGYGGGYLFKNCDLTDSKIIYSDYYRIIFNDCKLENLNFLGYGNKNEVIAVNCRNTKELQEQGIKVVSYNELEESLLEYPEKISQMFADLIKKNGSSNKLRRSDLRKIKLKTLKGDSIIYIAETDVEMESMITEYDKLFYSYRLLQEQKKRIDKN